MDRSRLAIRVAGRACYSRSRRMMFSMALARWALRGLRFVGVTLLVLVPAPSRE